MKTAFEKTSVPTIFGGIVMTNFKTSTLPSIAALLLAVIAAHAESKAPVLPMGALAHAAMALEQQTGGKVLEIRLMDAKGEPAFEAAVAQGDSIVYLRI